MLHYQETTGRSNSQAPDFFHPLILCMLDSPQTLRLSSLQLFSKSFFECEHNESLLLHLEWSLSPRALLEWPHLSSDYHWSHTPCIPNRVSQSQRPRGCREEGCWGCWPQPFPTHAPHPTSSPQFPARGGWHRAVAPSLTKSHLGAPAPFCSWASVCLSVSWFHVLPLLAHGTCSSLNSQPPTGPHAEHSRTEDMRSPLDVGPQTGQSVWIDS